MYLFLIVLALIVLILLIFFVVVIGLKACYLLDGLAKRVEITDYPEGLGFGEDIFQKPNRKKNQSTIRNKLKKRREKFGERTGGNS